jgi:hypothetical protein
MRAILEGGYLQHAGGTSTKELGAIVEMVLKLFLRKHVLAIWAGLADFDAILLEVIDGFP